ncbi:hypothetical protein FCV25MIE_11929 [Fagus crenata]
MGGVNNFLPMAAVSPDQQHMFPLQNPVNGFGSGASDNSLCYCYSDELEDWKSPILKLWLVLPFFSSTASTIPSRQRVIEGGRVGAPSCRRFELGDEDSSSHVWIAGSSVHREALFFFAFGL